ncbi:hypothetical protein FHS27_001581 [Rhodopirellula rubra]|uniref:Glycosyl transferases group 1 n=1 Tax=Aporhodopirellula rubra TaxID=980271 RepID=A0A7W5H3Y7_9BACT|nr:hypothetical protein [Aporhodopirellula rubra]MBB3205777.1 hypothetical protein [Aporhodopirellula rubra]
MTELPANIEQHRRLRCPFQMRWTHHRSGWPVVQAVIADRMSHPSGPTLFFGELEDALFQTGPFDAPWIGVVHQTFHAPAHIPRIYGGRSDLDYLLNHHSYLSSSMPHCRGIFTLSQHVAEQLTNHLDVPIAVLRLPTESSVSQFSFEQFKNARHKRIVQLGSWLRKFYPIYDLPIKGYKRLWLAGGNFSHRRATKLEGMRKRRFVRVSSPARITDAAYDEILSSSIAIVGLWESNANNSIVECIARGTPVLTNPLPAVKEYLGDDYPFYFDSLDQAAAKLADDGLIRETAAYLQQRQQHLWSTERFIREFTESDIYRSLPQSSDN